MKPMWMGLRALILLSALTFLNVACATRAEVEAIVQESNELGLASTEAQLLLADSEDDAAVVIDGGKPSGTYSARVQDLVTRIDEFIATHPQLTSINDALRMRKGFVLLNAAKFQSARTAFDSVTSPPLNARDRAIYTAREAFVWCYEALPADESRIPSNEMFISHIAQLDAVTTGDQAQSLDGPGRYLLACLRGFVSTKRLRRYAQGSSKKQQVLDSAAQWDLAFGNDIDHIVALANPKSAASDIHAIPREKIRWLAHAVTIIRLHNSVARNDLGLDLQAAEWPASARRVFRLN